MSSPTSICLFNIHFFWQYIIIKIWKWIKNLRSWDSKHICRCSTTIGWTMFEPLIIKLILKKWILIPESFLIFFVSHFLITLSRHYIIWYKISVCCFYNFSIFFLSWISVNRKLVVLKIFVGFFLKAWDQIQIIKLAHPWDRII